MLQVERQLNKYIIFSKYVVLKFVEFHESEMFVEFHESEPE